MFVVVEVLAVIVVADAVAVDAFVVAVVVW